MNEFGDRTPIAVTFTALGVVFLTMGVGDRRSGRRPADGGRPALTGNRAGSH